MFVSSDGVIDARGLGYSICIILAAIVILGGAALLDKKLATDQQLRQKKVDSYILEQIQPALRLMYDNTARIHNGAPYDAWKRDYFQDLERSGGMAALREAVKHGRLPMDTDDMYAITREARDDIYTLLRDASLVVRPAPVASA